MAKASVLKNAWGAKRSGLRTLAITRPGSMTLSKTPNAVITTSCTGITPSGSAGADAISILPALAWWASVKAPRSWPNSSLSSRVSGIAPQLTGTKGLEVTQRFDESQMDFTWLYAYPDYLGEVEVEVWAKPAVIEPGAGMTSKEEGRPQWLSP